MTFYVTGIRPSLASEFLLTYHVTSYLASPPVDSTGTFIHDYFIFGHGWPSCELYCYFSYFKKL